MTKQKFDTTKFSINDKIEYDGETIKLMSVDFKERLIGFNVNNDEDLHWARCENIKLL